MDGVVHAGPRINVDPATLWANIEDAGPQAHAYLGSSSVDSDDAIRSEHARRRSFIAYYAYAVPTRDAIAAIANFVNRRSMLEVCAGAGLWARLLSDVGVDMVATDGAQPRGSPFYPVHELEAEAAVRAHPDHDALLLCWPPDKRDVAHRALCAFIGDRLVCVGDARFIADADFQALLASEWIREEGLPLPSWPGIVDSLTLFSKRQST